MALITFFLFACLGFGYFGFNRFCLSWAFVISDSNVCSTVARSRRHGRTQDVINRGALRLQNKNVPLICGKTTVLFYCVIYHRSLRCEPMRILKNPKEPVVLSLLRAGLWALPRRLVAWSPRGCRSGWLGGAGQVVLSQGVDSELYSNC